MHAYFGLQLLELYVLDLHNSLHKMLLNEITVYMVKFLWKVVSLCKKRFVQEYSVIFMTMKPLGISQP